MNIIKSNERKVMMNLSFHEKDFYINFLWPIRFFNIAYSIKEDIVHMGKE